MSYFQSRNPSFFLLFSSGITSAASLSPYKPFSRRAGLSLYGLIYVQGGTRVYVHVCGRHLGGSNPSTFTFSLWPNLRPVLQQRGLLQASRQFNHTYSATPFSFPFHTASIPLLLHNSPLRAVWARLSVCSLLK